MAKTSRLFNKRRFSLATEWRAKRDAQKSADEWRSAGYQARVVKATGGYLVYVRKVAGR